jgi:hypothetical protein
MADRVVFVKVAYKVTTDLASDLDRMCDVLVEAVEDAGSAFNGAAAELLLSDVEEFETAEWAVKGVPGDG